MDKNINNTPLPPPPPQQKSNKNKNKTKQIYMNPHVNYKNLFLTLLVFIKSAHQLPIL